MAIITVAPSLRIARYRFDLEAVDSLHLPVYKGSTLRGGFGYAFKKMVCAQRDWMHCSPCKLANDCPYGYIFDSTLPEGSQLFADLQEVPPPFVLEPSLDGRREYQPGDRLAFHLVLVGRGISYLPYFLLAFQELGRMGIGSSRGRYVLQRIIQTRPWSNAEELVYDGVDMHVSRQNLGISIQEIEARATTLPDDQITLNFATPTRIKFRKSYIQHPEFHVLIRTLLRRLSSLVYFHCGELWNLPVRELIAEAEEIYTIDQRVRWVDWDRFSTHQQQRIDLGGFVGSATFQGDLKPFRSLLALGELLHIGKATVFGHGQFRVVLD